MKREKTNILQTCISTAGRRGQQYGSCVQWGPRSALTSAQSDQSPSPTWNNETRWSFNKHTSKTPISAGRRSGRSQTSMWHSIQPNLAAHRCMKNINWLRIDKHLTMIAFIIHVAGWWYKTLLFYITVKLKTASWLRTVVIIQWTNVVHE